MALQAAAAKWFRVLTVIALSGVIFVVGVVLYSVPINPGKWNALLRAVVLFAVLGALYGTIAALDSRSDFAGVDHPKTRTALCSLLGAAAVFVVWSWAPASFNVAWLLGGAIGGAILGWFGWRWAKYVDF